MENPLEELEGVVRAVTEATSTADTFASIDRYFTEDAILLYPSFAQIYTRNGRENVKAAYQVARAVGFGIKVEIHAVMINKDQTEATIDLTQTVRVRALPVNSVNVRCNFIVRLKLRKSVDDHKYRISCQQDNFPTDITQSGLPCPQIICILSDVMKGVVWLFIVTWGHIFIMLGIC